MKKRFFVLTLIIFLITSILSVKVFAANTTYSFNTTLTANNTRVASGGEVLITVRISSLNFSETGFNTFKAYVDYDKNVFEQLTDSSIEGSSGWTANYAVGTSLVTLVKTNLQKTDGELMQITLKTKEGLADGTQGEVKLSTIKIANSTDEALDSDPTSAVITIGNSSSGGTVGNTVRNQSSNNITPLNLARPATNRITPVNNSVPVNNSTPVNNSVLRPAVNNTINTTNMASNRIEVTNESDDDMPYTGPEDGLARIIIGVIFISLVIYIKIERMNRDIK